MPTETVLQRAARLRRRAEARAAATKYQDIAALSPEEAGRLLHELRVHQIELEMQNEELVRTQFELEESRARYFGLYHLAPAGYLTLSERGTILEANLRAGVMLGLPAGTLARRQLSRFILPEDSDVHHRHYRQLFRTGEPQVCEVRLAPRRAGAPITWVRLEMALAQDEEQRATVCRVVLSDITERQEMLAELRRYRDHLEGVVQERTAALQAEIAERAAAQEALRRSEATLAAAERIAHLGSWDRQLQTGEYHFSGELFQIFGLKPGDDPMTVRESIWATFHPDDFARLQAAYAHALKTGEPFDETYRIILPSGETRVVRGQTDVIRDAEGSIVAIHGMVQDITEQAAAQAGLHRNEASLKAAERLARMGSWEQNLTTGELWLSPNLRHILGVSAETPPETAQSALWNAMPPDDRREAEAARAQAMQTGEPYDGVFRFILPSGETRVLRGIVETERDAAGRTVFMRGTVQDITGQTATQAGLRRSESTPAETERVAHVGS